MSFRGQVLKRDTGITMMVPLGRFPQDGPLGVKLVMRGEIDVQFHLSIDRDILGYV